MMGTARNVAYAVTARLCFLCTRKIYGGKDMAKKIRRRSLRQKQKFMQTAGFAVGCMLVVSIALGNMMIQHINSKAAAPSREVEILAVPQTLAQQHTLEQQPAGQPGAASVALMTPPPVIATPVPTAEPTAVPTEEPYVPFEFLPVVQKADISENKIAITVDDCFQVDNLRTLCENAVSHGGRLTIFPIGENLSRSGMSDILKEYVFNHGFQIENHTWSHSRVFRLPEEEMAAEIWKNRNAVNQALGVNYQQSFFRLMGGDGEHDQRTHNYLKQLGYKGIASWSLSGSDATLDEMKQHLQPGAIYLFHTTDKDTANLAQFIPYVVSQGYEIVTLNELMNLPANTWTDLSTAETSAPVPVEYVVEYHDQQVGDYSWSVVQIQSRLMQLGYLDSSSDSALENTAADGVYGKGTASAVAAFQTAVGLPATGIADPYTQLELFKTA